MSDKREITGMWWFSPNSEERWTGTLTLEPCETPRLEIIVPKGFWNSKERFIPQVIHGHDENGAPITLLFPGPRQGTSSMAISRPTFCSGYAIQGIAINSADEFQAHSLTVSLHHLHQWAGLTGFQPNHEESFDKFTINYQHPDTLCFNIDDDLSIEIFVSYGAQNGLMRKSVYEETRITFKSKTGLTLKRCFYLINVVRQLLHFAALSKVYPVKISAFKEAHGRTIDGHFYPQEILIWSSIIRNEIESEHQSEWWVFRFSDIESRFTALFGGWLAFIEKYHEALDCYSTTTHHGLRLKGRSRTPSLRYSSEQCWSLARF
jgi:hypothetical protein